MKKLLVLVFLLCVMRLSYAGDLRVVIAPNLDKVIKPINAMFEKQNEGSRVVVIPIVSGAAYQQISNGYPVDIFMSADTKYPQELVKKGVALKNTYSVYAIGKLVVWTKENINLKNNCIENLLNKNIAHIALANPKLAPYGKAVLRALSAAGIYNKVKEKIVYSIDVSQAQQFAQTGNAQVAVIPLSLVIKSNTGHYCELDQKLYKPIKQAMVILKTSREKELAKKYLTFIKSEQAKSIFKEFGYYTK